MSNHQSRLLGMLIMLTSLLVAAQITVFFIHYKVSILVDALVNSSVASAIFYPVVIVPLLGFLALQILAYILLVSFVWFIAVATGDLLKLSSKVVYCLGLLCWLFICLIIFILNSRYFPHSFFAKQFNQSIFLKVFIVASFLLLLVTTLSYIHYFKYKRYRLIGSIFLGIIFLNVAYIIHDKFFNKPFLISHSSTQPDIIFIGLDSLRPDFTSYFGHHIKTPNIDHFLKTGVTFTKTYTPLARTYPAWISILTAQYPKHTSARNNLVDSAFVIHHDTLAKRLALAGYETIYATDENRFSNITKAYGFSHVVGPRVGINDFLLGGLSDFPLTNLLTQLPIARFLFPYHYGNRAAAITYQPDHFLHLLTSTLNARATKPLFLAVHLCLSHWPFMWALDGNQEDESMINRYQNSVKALDDQLGQLMQLLKENGLLEKSIVVLLSDHGTTFGLRGDRLLNKKNYHGDASKLKLITVAKLSSAPVYSIDFKNDYTMETAYGQGTDVFSLKQHHVLLAFKSFGDLTFTKNEVPVMSSLLDIAPTILDLLNLPPLREMDGISLKPYFDHLAHGEKATRVFFMETGDSLSDIETDDIKVDKVIQNRIGVYQVDPVTGLLQMRSAAEASLIKNKQLAIFWQDWILARYPTHLQTKLVPSKEDATKYLLSPVVIPAYFVLANVKTGQWTIGFSDPFARQVRVEKFMQKLKQFYGDEW